MALVLKDRVKETSITTGTGTLTLAGASSGYQAFSVIGNGNTTYYTITDPATGDWEVGIGTYTSSGTTLSRTMVLDSSNTGSLVDFAAGTKDVFCVYPAEKAIFEEENGETLIDGGPITVVGSGVSVIPSLPAELGKFVGNIDSFAQIYNLNQSSGSGASADFVAYNDLTDDGYNNFIDMGINSSGYTSVDYPIFTPGSGYLFHDGDDFFIGNQTPAKDVVLFAGGADTTDEAVRISGTDRSVTTDTDVNVGGDLDVTGAATFGSTVLLDADPTLALQAATKQYVDSVASAGLTVHDPVRVEKGSNLTATYNNGTSGVGATLTNAGTQEALVIDGVSVSVADRVLVYGQTDPVENGVYVVTTVGSGATNWVLTRASDADTYAVNDPDALDEGSYFFVSEGSTGAYESYVCTTTGTITFGTTAITFAQFSSVPSYVVNAPLNLTGNVLSLSGTVAATNGGTGTNTVTTGDLLYGSGTNTWGKLAKGTGYKSLVMNSGGTQVEWNAVALNQSAAVSGSLGATNGGTGQSTYATGDTLYSSASNTLSKLSGNTSTTPKYLRQVGTGSASQAPTWDTLAASDITSGTLAVARGGTGLGSYAVGDIVYASGTGTLAGLADIATGNVLLSGGANTAPAYGKVGLSTHVSGTLPTANGGTALTSFTSGGAMYATSTSALTTGTLPVTAGGTGVTTSTGSGSNVLNTSPTFVTPILGTPTSVTLTNATGLPLTTGVTGTLAVGNGGTGVATLSGLAYGNGTSAFTAASAAQIVAAIGSTFVTNATNATNATNTAASTIVNDVATATAVYPVWSNGTSGSQALEVSNTKLSFVPSTGALTATTFVGALSGNATTATTLATGRTIAITGDLTYTSPSFNGSGNVTAAGTLATVNANVGSFTNATLTVNAKGLITAASSGTAPVTSVTGTSPVVSSGGTTPAISMPAATTSVSGYLTSTDWNTFNNKTSNTGTVTSITAGSYLTGGTITTSGTITVDATTTNTASKVVARDASGNFAAGTITATLSGNATSATTATTATTATNSTNATITTSATASAFKVPFANTTASTTGNYGLLQDSTATFTYNPSTNVLTVGTVSGALSGNATTATTATNATNTGITNDTTTNATMYPTWVTTTTGNLPQKVSSTKFTFNPSTGAVSATSFIGSGASLTALNATQLTTGTIPGDRGVTAGSASSSFVEYNGTTNTAGQFYGGTTNPTGTTRLNYSGYFYPTYINLIASPDTATAATHYYVETASDGYVRPKTLANVKTEIVTAAAITAGLGTTAVTNATNAANVAVTTSATASAFKVPFANTTASTTGNYGLLQDSTATFTYNPSTNVLAVGTLSGSLSGGTVSATTISATGGYTATSAAPFYLNATTVSANYTIPANYNASSAGPITINTGVTVTVSTGSTWVVV